MSWRPEFPVLVIDDELHDENAAGKAMRAICAAIEQFGHSILQATTELDGTHIRFNEAFMMHGSTSPQYAIIASNDIAAKMIAGSAGRSSVPVHHRNHQEEMGTLIDALFEFKRLFDERASLEEVFPEVPRIRRHRPRSRIHLRRLSLLVCLRKDDPSEEKAKISRVDAALLRIRSLVSARGPVAGRHALAYRSISAWTAESSIR